MVNVLNVKLVMIKLKVIKDVVLMIIRYTFGMNIVMYVHKYIQIVINSTLKIMYVLIVITFLQVVIYQN